MRPIILLGILAVLAACQDVPETAQPVDAAAPAATLSSVAGRYEGTGTNGSLTVDASQSSAKVNLRGNGCLGEIEGPVATRADGSWTVTGGASGIEQCTLTMRPAGNGFSVMQSDGCRLYHGQACAYPGTIAKTN